MDQFVDAKCNQLWVPIHTRVFHHQITLFCYLHNLEVQKNQGIPHLIMFETLLYFRVFKNFDGYFINYFIEESSFKKENRKMSGDNILKIILANFYKDWSIIGFKKRDPNL